MRINAKVELAFSALLVLVMLVSSADAHGWLENPPSRNNLINNVWTAPPGIAYNQNSGNGRAFEVKGSVTQQPGVCGDPWQTLTDRQYSNYVFSLPWGQAASMANPASPNIPTFSPGQRVSFRWTVTASHTGYFALKLCPQRDITDAAALQACFDRYPLQRADGQGRQWWELQYSTTTQTFSADYLLPAGVSCPNGCMIQWEYVTANTCWTRGMCENPSVCGQFSGSTPNNWCSATVKPERFYNCADIRISGSGGQTTPPPPTTCPTTCPTAGVCKVGGGCNTATRACNPITNAANGSPCSGGTCQNGACIPTPPPPAGTCPAGLKIAAAGAACGAGVACCPSGQCCSQWGWCGTTSAHCSSGCQRTFSGSGVACTSATIAAATKWNRRIAPGALAGITPDDGHAEVANGTLPEVTPTTSAVVTPDVTPNVTAQAAALPAGTAAAEVPAVSSSAAAAVPTEVAATTVAEAAAVPVANPAAAAATVASDALAAMPVVGVAP